MLGSLQYQKAGMLKVVATTAKSRVASLPDVPTVAETISGFEFFSWYGLWAPRGTPASIVNQLATQAAQALKQPDVHKQYVDMGAEPVGSTPEEFTKYITAERAKWEEIVRKADVKAGE